MKMSTKGRGSYVPPAYIPLEGSPEVEEKDVESAAVVDSNRVKVRGSENNASPPQQWSSGICACCDDPQSCLLGGFCPCFLFGKNVEFLGSGTFMGSCTTHFILWGLVNTVCCFLSEGVLLGLPGCFVACYACSYRRTLRLKYNLKEAPCGDFVTHLFCHLCAMCQEYREIRERSAGSNSTGLNLVEVTPPPPQSMEPVTN